jgi:hypothetical protein
METTLLDVLWNDLANLDEQAGCFDEDTNASIDRQRQSILNQIKDLEYKNGVHSHRFR